MTRLSAVIRMLLSILALWGFASALYLEAPRLAADVTAGYWGTMVFAGAVLGFALAVSGVVGWIWIFGMDKS